MHQQSGRLWRDIEMTTFDDTSGGTLDWDFHQCTTGHPQFPPFLATPGHKHHAEAYVMTNGGNTASSFGAQSGVSATLTQNPAGQDAPTTRGEVR